MTLLDWKEELSVGVRDIDEQHRRLMEAANGVEQALTGGAPPEQVGARIDDLIEATRVHFAYEEDLMYRHLYVSRIAHKEGHEHLLFRIRRLKEDVLAGAAHRDAQTLAFLREWLIDHIVHADRMLGEYLNSRKLF